MNLGACYCHVSFHPGKIALLLSLRKGSLGPHTGEAKAEGLTFFFHPLPLSHVQGRTQFRPINVYCSNDCNCCLFLNYAPSHPFKDWDCWFLQKMMHTPFGKDHLLKRVNRLMENESGWAEIRQRWESLFLSCGSPVGWDHCSFGREASSTWQGHWNLKVELSVQVNTGNMQYHLKS